SRLPARGLGLSESLPWDMSPPAVTKLRASELVGLRWDDIDWQTSTLHVRRSKGGIGTRQPLAARELRALRRLQREAHRAFADSSRTSPEVREVLQTA